MTILQILRALWVVVGGLLGYVFGALWDGEPLASQVGALAGALLGLLVAILESALGRYPLRSLLGATMGLLLGLAAARLMLGIFPPASPTLLDRALLSVGLLFFLGSLGWALGLRKGQEFSLRGLSWSRREERGRDVLLLDTSVIIDGRVADICEAGFLRNTMAMPRFILRELQQIADSSDPMKRARGRRGLDVLKRIQDQGGMEVQILDQDFPRIRDVDGKLVEMARLLDAPILTNDFNLNKVAELQGVRVLNINQLANALKPVFLPGEVMRVRIIKEGKEEGQGVGYLDDGTMVVVDSAKRFLGRSIEVAVTSVLQTAAGRMIFTVVKNNGEAHAQNARE
jgi:uncharacterized protein YacL